MYCQKKLYFVIRLIRQTGKQNKTEGVVLFLLRSCVDCLWFCRPCTRDSCSRQCPDPPSSSCHRIGSAYRQLLVLEMGCCMKHEKYIEDFLQDLYAILYSQADIHTLWKQKACQDSNTALRHATFRQACRNCAVRPAEFPPIRCGAFQAENLLRNCEWSSNGFLWRTESLCSQSIRGRLIKDPAYCQTCLKTKMSERQRELLQGTDHVFTKTQSVRTSNLITTYAFLLNKQVVYDLSLSRPLPFRSLMGIIVFLHEPIW